MTAARLRRPTIRRVREWVPERSLRLAPPPRELLATIPADSDFIRPSIDEDEARTLCPTTSEVRGILVQKVYDDEDEEDAAETLLYVAPAPKEEPESEEIALGALVSVYEKRVDDLEEQRRIAIAAAARAEERRERLRERRAMKAARRARRDRIVRFVSDHRYKFIYSFLCLWGLVQLVLAK